MTHWFADWKTGKVKEKNEPRVMNASETIENLRKSPELRDSRHPGYAEAHAKLTAAYKELYGDAVEEDNAQ